jgi:hypothetical protein
MQLNGGLYSHIKESLNMELPEKERARSPETPKFPDSSETPEKRLLTRSVNRSQNSE